jgi:hypothetical protein
MAQKNKKKQFGRISGTSTFAELKISEMMAITVIKKKYIIVDAI